MKSEDGRRPKCWLRFELCYCALVQPIHTKTKISIVMHSAERYKTSGTARLLELLLSNSTVYQVGLKDEPFTALLPDRAGTKRLLLFPDPSAPELTESYCKELGENLHLIIPDGTWPQAKRIARHKERLGDPINVRIAPAQTEYRLRRNLRSGTLCTAEAVAYALGALEGQLVEDKILELFREMTRRIISTRRSWRAYLVGK